MRGLIAFIRLGRPHFLVGGFVMHGLGVAAALYAGARLNVAALAWGQVAVTATQLMVHYANDYFDLEVDRANQTPTHWSGGSRMLPGGQVNPRAALIAALFLALLAAGAGLVLALKLRRGPLALPLIALALALAWAYSAPPFRLHSRGLGELATTIIVPGLTPLLGFYLQSGRLAPILLLAVAPLLGLQVNVQLAVEYPDVVGDAATGKRTLPVRGAARAARLHLLALAAAYAALPLAVAAGLPLAVAAAAGLAAPLAAWHGWRLAHGAWARPAHWNTVAFTSIALLIITAAAEAAAFAWLAIA